MIVGAPFNDAAGLDAGRAYVFLRALATDDPTTTDVPSDESFGFRFAPPWPNPARGELTLAFELASDALATVEAFDANGRVVDRPLARERLPAGRVIRVWNPVWLAPGHYFLCARVGRATQMRPFVWLGGW